MATVGKTWRSVCSTSKYLDGVGTVPIPLGFGMVTVSGSPKWMLRAAAGGT